VPQKGRELIFLQAQKQISSMLAQNLLDKFKATEEYKEVVSVFDETSQLTTNTSHK